MALHVNCMMGVVTLKLHVILISRVWVVNASTIIVFKMVQCVTIMGNARTTVNVISTTAASSVKVVLVRISNT